MQHLRDYRDLLYMLEDFDKWWHENGTRLDGKLTNPYVSDLMIWLREVVSL